MVRVYLGAPRKHGGPRRWFIDYVDVGGRRHRDATDAQTKTEARALLTAKLS